jgi:hypothetical protein
MIQGWRLLFGALLSIGLCSVTIVAAQEKKDEPKKDVKKDEPKKDAKKDEPKKDEPKKDPPAPFAVTITGDIDAELAPVAGRLTTIFYQSYPKLVERFDNPKRPAPRQIRVVFEKNMKVPAYCTGAEIKVSVEWLKKNPDDVALLTHELTHSVQGYRAAPSWMTEGIADYARLIYGPKEQPGWSLPERLTARQSYKDSYRTTARFLVWLDAKHPGIVDKLHRKLQDRDFSVDDFKTITGSTVDALWDECVKDLSKKK